MKVLITLLILAIQNAANAYLTPPGQTFARPAAPLAIPLAGGGLAGYTAPPLYNLGLNTNFNQFATPTFNALYRPPMPFSVYSPPTNPVTSLYGAGGLSPFYNPMFTMPSSSYFPNYNYGMTSMMPVQNSYFPSSYFPSSYVPSSMPSSYSPVRLASGSSLSDTYGVNERIPIRSAETKEVETYSTADSSGYSSGGDRIALASGGTGSSGDQTSANYRTVVTSPSTGAQPPRAVTRPVGRRVTPATREERRAQSAPIWIPFMERFKACEKNCEPTGYSTWGERGNDSCHPQGLAVDISGMYCSDDRRHYSAKDRWDRFQNMVECMKTQMRFYRVHPNGRREIKVGVLYRQHKGRGETRDHWDHAHFSLGCYDGWVY